MAERPLQVGGGLQTPSTTVFIVAPLSFTGTYLALQWMVHTKGLLPAYIPKTLPSLTFRCVGLASIPLILQVIALLLFRLLLQPAAESKVSKVHSNTITNTIEQTLIFSLNLLAFSTCRMATPELVILVTLFFLVSRFVFWLGYYLFYCTESPMWRGPGMAMSLGVNFFLFYYAMQGLLGE